MDGYYIKARVDRCDAKEQMLKSTEDGAIFVTEGGAGRWSENMVVGSDYIAKHKIKPMSEEKARIEIERRGGYLQI